MTAARPLLPLWAALVLAAGSGPILDAAFPDLGVWPLAFPAVALVLVSLVGRRAGSAFLVGFVAGLAFYLVHIQWASLFLGLLPMTALSVLESLFWGLGAIAMTLAYRWIPRAFPTPPSQVSRPATTWAAWSRRWICSSTPASPKPSAT